MKYLRTLNDDITSAVVEPVIQRNGYMIHSESIILAMLCDDSVRQSAIEKIMQARRKNGNNTMRKFIIPKINFLANSYHSMIDWSELHEPTVRMTMRLWLWE